MVKISKVNTIIFLLMFFAFVLTSKTMMLFHVKITGIEYLMWFGFAGLLILVNMKFFLSEFLLKQTYFLLLFILALFTFLNYFFAEVALTSYLQGAFFSFLFAANFILFYNIKIEKRNFYRIVDAIIILLTAIAALAYAERLLINRAYTSFFLRGVQTIAKDPGFAATLLNINIVLCLAMFIVKKNSRYLYIAAFSFITIVLLLFLKAIVSSLIISIAFIFIFFNLKTRKILIWSFIILASLFLIIFGKPLIREIHYKQKLYFGSRSETTPRMALYITGFKIAKDYFPFGSGQGTFGSYPVGKNYSPVYYQYKLDRVYGLGPDAMNSTKENFLFDTYWSHIIGEMGFIASFFYLWLWFFPVIKTIGFLVSYDVVEKSMSFIVAMTLITIFVESFALSIPEQLQFIMLYAGLGAVAFKLLNVNTTNKLINL